MENMRRKLLMNLIEKMREKEHGEMGHKKDEMMEELEMEKPKHHMMDEEHDEDDHEMGEHDPEEEEEMDEHMGESPEDESLESLMHKDFKYHPRTRPGLEILMGVGPAPKMMGKEKKKPGRKKGFKMKRAQ